MGHRPSGHRGIVSPSSTDYNDNDGDNDDGMDDDDSKVMDASMNLSLSELQEAAARAQVSFFIIVLGISWKLERERWERGRSQGGGASEK